MAKGYAHPALVLPTSLLCITQYPLHFDVSWNNFLAENNRAEEWGKEGEGDPSFFFFKQLTLFQ